MNKIQETKEAYQQYLESLLASGKFPEYIKEKSKELSEKIIDFRHELHENPELGGQEIETTQRIKRELEKVKNVEILAEVIPVKDKKGREIGRTGIVARIKGKEGGPTIALRADIDALPIEENPNNPYVSKKKGVMHGCGHDTHTAALVGAAEILNNLAEHDKLDGDVIFLFQPSEERTFEKESGAVRIIRFLERAGIRQKIDAFFGLHIHAPTERGIVRLREGPFFASSGDFEITLKAPGGHIMESYKVPNIDELMARIKSEIANKFSPGQKAGPSEWRYDPLVGSAATEIVGTAGYNILAREEKSRWVVRILMPEYQTAKKEVLDAVKKIIKEVTEPWKEAGLRVEFKFNPGYRRLVHRDPKLVELSRQVAKEIIDENVKFNEEPEMGGEDFSFYLETLRGKTIPGAFMLVGAANPEKGIPKMSHHQPNFKIVDETVIPEMSALYADTAIKAIEHFKKKEGPK